MIKCKICNKEFKSRLSSHVKRIHVMDYKDYLIKYEHNGEIPKCTCGCNIETPFTTSGGMSFNKYIHGHNAKDKIWTKEARESIGKKNSNNMKCFMRENPDVAKLRSKQMNAGQTKEVRKRTAISIRSTYDNMSDKEKQKFSDHSARLWAENKEVMQQGAIKAGKTFSKNFDDGKHDFTERDKKISESITKKYLEGGFQWARGHYTSTKWGKTYYYRSSWELKYMQLLDSDDNVGSWKYEPFSLEYKINGKAKNYIPDFIVTRKSISCGYIFDELVEIKPQALTDTKVNKAKRKAALKWCKENNYCYTEVWYNEIINEFEKIDYA